MPQAIPLIASAAIAGAGAATSGVAITVLGVTLTGAAFGAFVAVSNCVGPVTISERRPP